MAIKLAASVLIVCGIISSCSGSAIPMWEFLSRDEKMSHLYSMLGKLVSDYCKTNSGAMKLSVAQCKHDLLGYGSNQLHRMSNNQLDNMDIFQRGAPEIIWAAAMNNHPTVKTVQTKIPSIVTLSPASSSSSAIVIIGNTNQKQQRNPLFDSLDKKDSSSSYAMGMDTASGYNHRYPGSYNEPQNHLHQEAASSVGPTTYLSGPLVIRVRPDGTPVEEDKHRPLPYDDDREVIAIGRARYNGKGHQQQTIKHYRSIKNYRETQRH